MNYNKKINYLRGLGIILVVLGHSFPTGDFNGNSIYSYIHKFIYSFHMPLFFWISGVCSIGIYKVIKENKYKEFYVKKLSKLIVPYFAIALLATPIKLILNKFSQRPIVLSDLVKNILFYPGEGPVVYMWYVYTLFIIFAILPIVVKIPKWIALPVFIVLNIISPNMTGFMCIATVCRSLIYFYLGLLSVDYLNKYKLKMQINLILLMVLIGANLLPQYPIYVFITSILGIILSVNVVEYLDRLNRVNVLDYLGNMSYDIYLFSWFFMTGFRVVFYQVLKFNYGSTILILFISGFLPIILSKLIIRKNRVLSKLFLGIN